MTSFGAIRWILLALLGLAVAAAVSVAASQLVSQHIGLAAQPVSVVKELAPQRREPGKRAHKGGGGNAGGPAPTSTTTVPPTTTTPTSTVAPAPTTAPPSSTSPSKGSQDSGVESEGPDD